MSSRNSTSTSINRTNPHKQVTKSFLKLPHSVFQILLRQLSPDDLFTILQINHPLLLDTLAYHIVFAAHFKTTKLPFPQGVVPSALTFNALSKVSQIDSFMRYIIDFTGVLDLDLTETASSEILPSLKQLSEKGLSANHCLFVIELETGIFSYKDVKQLLEWFPNSQIYLYGSFNVAVGSYTMAEISRIYVSPECQVRIIFNNEPDEIQSHLLQFNVLAKSRYYSILETSETVHLNPIRRLPAVEFTGAKTLALRTHSESLNTGKGNDVLIELPRMRSKTIRSLTLNGSYLHGDYMVGLVDLPGLVHLRLNSLDGPLVPLGSSTTIRWNLPILTILELSTNSRLQPFTELCTFLPKTPSNKLTFHYLQLLNIPYPSSTAELNTFALCHFPNLIIAIFKAPQFFISKWCQINSPKLISLTLPFEHIRDNLSLAEFTGSLFPELKSLTVSVAGPVCPLMQISHFEDSYQCSELIDWETTFLKLEHLKIINMPLHKDPDISERLQDRILGKLDLPSLKCLELDCIAETRWDYSSDRFYMYDLTKVITSPGLIGITIGVNHHLPRFQTLRPDHLNFNVMKYHTFTVIGILHLENLRGINVESRFTFIKLEECPRLAILKGVRIPMYKKVSLYDDSETTLMWHGITKWHIKNCPNLQFVMLGFPIEMFQGPNFKRSTFLSHKNNRSVTFIKSFLDVSRNVDNEVITDMPDEQSQIKAIEMVKMDALLQWFSLQKNKNFKTYTRGGPPMPASEFNLRFDSPAASFLVNGTGTHKIVGNLIFNYGQYESSEQLYKHTKSRLLLQVGVTTVE